MPFIGTGKGQDIQIFNVDMIERTKLYFTLVYLEPIALPIFELESTFWHACVSPHIGNADGRNMLTYMYM